MDFDVKKLTEQSQTFMFAHGADTPESRISYCVLVYMVLCCTQPDD